MKFPTGDIVFTTALEGGWCCSAGPWDSAEQVEEPPSPADLLQQLQEGAPHIHIQGCACHGYTLLAYSVCCDVHNLNSERGQF